MTGAGLLNDLLKIADKNSNDTGYRALGLVWLDYIIMNEFCLYKKSSVL